MWQIIIIIIIKFGFYRSHSLILVTGSSTWHLMAKNSLRIWKKELLLYIKIASAIRKLLRPWNWAAAQWPRSYSGLTGPVPLRTGLAMVDQRSWVHVLRVISTGCVWEIETYECCQHCCRVWRGGGRALQLIACDYHAYLVSKAGSVTGGKFPSPAFKWSGS